MATKKQAEAPKAAPAEAPAAEGEAQGEVDESKLSYVEIAALSDKPVITTSRQMAAFPPPDGEDKPPSIKPNFVLKDTVIWGPLPKDPPPKPNLRAADIKSHVMERPGAKPKPRPSIGSMQPSLGGKK